MSDKTRDYYKDLTQSQKDFLKDLILFETMEYTILDAPNDKTLTEEEQNKFKEILNNPTFKANRAEFIHAINQMADFIELSEEDWPRGK
jgi:hypothetical protein